MYVRGTFPPPHGQGPETSVSTSQQLVPPQLPPPPYQQGDRTQNPQMMEKGPPFYPTPHQAYPRPYVNGHHVSAPSTGIPSSGQSYLIPLSRPPAPSQTQGHSTQMAHPFSGPQQNSQWTQNVQPVIPPLPPTFGRPPSGRSGPEMLLPPPPPRLQPPMLSQGQPLYRGFVPSPLPGPVQGLQHTPLTQPPPPTHTPYTHGPFGSIVHPVSQAPRKSSTGLLPPPLPPSPPPGPPPPPATSPPPTSSSSLSKRPPISPSSQSKSAAAQQHDVPQEDVQTSDAPAGSVQVDSLIDEVLSHSPADSNMDIEDEMIEIDENKRCSEIVDGKSVLVSSECEVEKELHEPNILANHTSPEESASQNTFSSDKSESADHREDVKRPNAAASADYEKVSTDLVKGTSAFKLLQDYASDDNSDSDHELCIKDIASAPVYPSGESAAACLESETGSDFMKNETTKNSSESERGFGLSSERGVSLDASMPSKSLDSLLVLQGPSKEVDATIIMKDNRPDYNRHANQLDMKSGTSDKDSEQKSNRGSHNRPAFDVEKTRKEDGKYDSASQLKVDEFGRLVRESDSGSDSDDLRHSRRHGKRGRIRSRSRSPYDRRRRSPQGRMRSRSRSPHDRRSPRRRRQKRSRSRSWSPKRQRSRSRSPIRHGVQYGSDRTRRDKVPSQACFDYQKGKCYRGASCRYSHSDSTKSDLSRGYRSKYQAVQLSPKKTGKSVHKNDEDKSQEMQLCRDLSGNILGASKDCSVDRKEIASARNFTDKDVELLISSVAESVRTREAVQVQVTERTRDDWVKSSIHESADSIYMEAGVTPNDANKLPPGSTCHGTETSMGQKLQANLVNQGLQKADHHPQPLDAPSTHDPETLPASEANLNRLSVPELSYLPHPATGSAEKSFSSETYSTQRLKFEEPSPKNSHQPSQFLPHPPPTSQATNAPPQMPRDYIMMPQSSRYQSLPNPPDNFTPYQASLSNQHASFSISGNSAWNSLPQPPRRQHDNESTVHVSSSYGLPSSQFQENQLPLRNDFPQMPVRPYSTEMHTYSQVGESHRQFYPPTQQPSQPLSHVEDNKSNALPTVSTTTQQFGGPSTVGNGGLSHGGQILSVEGSVRHQPISSSAGSSAGRIQSFGSSNLQSGEPLSSSSQRYSNLQQPLDAFQHPTDGNVSVIGKPGTTSNDISSYSSDYFQRNMPSHVPDFVGSRIPTYYNPYASTFEQPASLKVSSNAFSEVKGMPNNNTHGDPYSSSHVSADVRVVDIVDSKNVTCLTNSNQPVEKTLLNSTGDQYDPLFDSIEPSSNSFRTPNNDQKNEITDDSDINMKLSGSNKPLDFAENTKQKEAEAVAVMSSLDNDEYGETAEAEVGAVENGSPSDPVDEANIAEGETEIDQVNTSGRSKKGKDSRSMKLFKGALADFVKEVLKPSWRQGNMSKEAFKTIVKKTVDKVSGAMKSHQVPKSQTKIDHYIDSSQRKLTKLVMGYVDKYVKV
ncbi:uncharacterized protein LOC141671457 [Apium graveolens]|uniref:uncharacterized protein LOC141671457 n=1 Tax=Apium graveolens TaxID=4045 RepID=UPI003D7A5249